MQGLRVCGEPFGFAQEILVEPYASLLADISIIHEVPVSISIFRYYHSQIDFLLRA
jgi:hypothetical protein